MNRVWSSDPVHALTCPAVDGSPCTCRIAARLRPTLAELLDALVPDVEVERNEAAS